MIFDEAAWRTLATEFRVPSVVAMGPWKLRSERRAKVEHGPWHHHTVVRAKKHAEEYHANSNTYKIQNPASSSKHK